MALAHSPSVPPFDTESEPSSVGPRWNKWLQRFENYTTAVNITGDPRLKALLLHLAGERVHDIYDTVAAEADKYADVKAKLTEYFSPKKNVQYEVYIFRKAAQQPGENLDAYNPRLHMLAKYCEFRDVDNDNKVTDHPKLHVLQGAQIRFEGGKQDIKRTA